MTPRSARIPSRPNASGAAPPDFVTRALIAGAGIGGLTAALALSQAGFEVTIFERAPALEAFGAGLQLTPNATRILAKLDILDAVRALASEPRGLRILRGRDDAELAALDLTASGRRWGAPYLIIHRADLQGALADAARTRANIDLRLGIELAGVDEQVGVVAVELQSRSGFAARNRRHCRRRRRAALAGSRTARAWRRRRCAVFGPGRISCDRPGAGPTGALAGFGRDVTSGPARASRPIPSAGRRRHQPRRGDRIWHGAAKPAIIPGTAPPTFRCWSAHSRVGRARRAR